ncbi:hypothetical protein JJ728_23380, partial [Salmonella enterica subsp. enterica serovar Typhi]|nr:hypothetical protein [Salmonella enterica subsp. enterica serovar Typhi]
MPQRARAAAKVGFSRWGNEKYSGTVRVGTFGLVHASRVRLRTPQCLFERWHPEINLFHMSFGEMSITLHDVAYILGILIDRFPIHWKIKP